VNALSKDFEVTSWRDGRFRRARFQRGILQKDDKGKDAGEASGTFVRFTPDPEIFPTYQWNEEFLEHRLRYYAFLNAGLTLVFGSKRYRSREGLADLLRHELGEETPLYDIVHCRGEQLEFAFTHTTNYGETWYSFVNGQYTNDGGTHQSAFREGVLKGVNEYARQSFAGEDVRDGIVGAVAI
jgi:topoisomerase-4 subunit B